MSLCKRFCGLKLCILQRLKDQEKDQGPDPSQSALTPEEVSTLKLHDGKL